MNKSISHLLPHLNKEMIFFMANQSDSYTKVRWKINLEWYWSEAQNF